MLSRSGTGENCSFMRETMAPRYGGARATLSQGLDKEVDNLLIHAYHYPCCTFWLILFARSTKLSENS